ncbi:hypothetical protein CEP52_014000 [Fusarium oligoseptatum]|uniref:Zn(2)-C6 fungal-type domain-containing protein n=1 Tax=Fusarium oligoseptatum TaxID=2604345 RepID=A0A428SQY6_9HYPO|nr:hypothetical protein CEP52_014000 [Fusarium oligoseptatum]
MYKPAPRRVKKTNIVRTRTGCITCRERRKKCDEKKPACSTCSRLGKRCEKYKAGFNFKNVTFETSPSPPREAHKTRARFAPQENYSPEAVAAETPLSHESSSINSTAISKASPRVPGETVYSTPLSDSMISLPISPSSDMGGSGLEFTNTFLGDGFALWAGDVDYGTLKPLTAEYHSPQLISGAHQGAPSSTLEGEGPSTQTQRPLETPLLFGRQLAE